MVQHTDIAVWTLDFLQQENKRYLVHQGGTSSGKTYNVMIALFAYAAANKGIVSVVSKDMPALRRGAIRDTAQMLSNNESLANVVQAFNKSTNTYYLKSGSEIEFVSYADEYDARAGKRDILFIDEANNIPFSIFESLEIRSDKVVIAYNPSLPFWAHDKIIPLHNAKFIRSTYNNNEYASKAIVQAIESKKITDPDWYKVYGEGRTGALTNTIFKTRFGQIPAHAEPLGIGLDWGFSTSPTAAALVYKADDTLYLKQILYSTNLQPDVVGNMLSEFKRYRIVADSASPSSNAKLQSMGYNIKPVSKPKVEDSIRTLQGYDLVIDLGSPDFITEATHYLYDDKGQPIKKHDHLWDATRYLLHDLYGSNKGGMLAFG